MGRARAAAEGSGSGGAESAIREIRKRNAKVEADKAWETSWARRGLIFLSTYLVVVLFLLMIGAKDAWATALVPAGAYLLSTLTLPFAKEFWLKSVYRK
jgi:hypothetical protein